MTDVLLRLVTEVSRIRATRSSTGLRARRVSGQDAAVSRTLLEPFWPGRRAHAFDEFCR